MLTNSDESTGYDFQDPENNSKWKGIFIAALRKVLEQVHPALSAEESALFYVESLCLQLLSMLCAVPSPLTVQDVEERVAKSFPTPIDKWALTDARELADKAKKKKIIFPTESVHHMLQKEVFLCKIDMSVTLFIVAILEYICADILKLAGNYVKKISQKNGFYQITSQDIKTAMCADKALTDMFYQEEETQWCPEDPTSATTNSSRGMATYAETVRDLLADERQYLRELHLIIRVFREEVERIVGKDSKTLELIFANIMDVYELTVTLLDNLEDALEMSQDSAHPYIGRCFGELADVEEFRVYETYAKIITSKESKQALQNIVDDPEVCGRLQTGGLGLHLAVKYYLPRLLNSPIAHLFLYHQYILQLIYTAPLSEEPVHTAPSTDDTPPMHKALSDDDKESLKQVECNLHPIKKYIKKLVGSNVECKIASATRARRQMALVKTNELSRLIDNWDNRHIGQYCNEFIREDTVSKIVPGKRISERRAYLFDGLLILCKPVTSLVTVGSSVSGLSSVVNSSNSSQLKLKEKLFIRKIDIVDRNDTDDMKNCVELKPRAPVDRVTIALASNADKRSWMADLVMLYTKSMLERTLDSILLDLEKKHPLRIPSPTVYRFAQPDAPDNIIFEERSINSQAPLIKGASLLKLVERLTYHVYADLELVRTFLTTYRSFCAPRQLLSLLVERFNIPPLQSEGGNCLDVEKLAKRYKKEFVKPVRLRVMNVLKYWVDQHFYDFEQDPELLARLTTFLQSVREKQMQRWGQIVLNIVQRKGVPKSIVNSETVQPPPCERHPADDPELYNWHILALHPLELARQLTLLEFELYRTVKVSELVGAVWTKKDKDTNSPNLMKIIKHTTNFTRWIEKCIVECKNFEERIAVVTRVLETAVALNGLNNFNGVLAVVAAMESAAIHRLQHTIQRFARDLEEFQRLNADHQKKYLERLRSINPPCVPFFGIYMDYILHIEEGNNDFLPDSVLINFSKRRKVAEITGEIQQYQNQPYCLTVDMKTRAFLESLDPFPGMDTKEVSDYLYARSLEIEPRGAPPVRAPRKWLELSLKSPGIKPSTRRNDNDDNISICGPAVSPPGGSRDVPSPPAFGHLEPPSSRTTRNRISISATSPRYDTAQAEAKHRQIVDEILADGCTTHQSTLAVSPRPNDAPPLLPRGAAPPPPTPALAHTPAHTPAQPHTPALALTPTITPDRGMSPKRSPALPHAANGMEGAFDFPPPRSRSELLVPSDESALGHDASGPPPPLPPRRRASCASPPAATSSAAPPPPPPLPPRQPLGPLLEPDHSVIMRRRQNTVAPTLPPKPQPAVDSAT